MTKPTIKVDGARDLRRALKAVDGGITDLKRAHADAAEVVEQRASELVPVLDGILDSSIRSAGQAAGGIVRAGSASVRYAGPIHFGWPARGIAPQPFLYDALDDRANQVLEVYEDRVGQVIRKHGLN